MDLNEALPCELVIFSGLAIALAGYILRRFLDRRRKPEADPVETGGERNSYLLMIVGLVWAGYGVVQCVA
jgi:hypothetical protein